MHALFVSFFAWVGGRLFEVLRRVRLPRVDARPSPPPSRRKNVHSKHVGAEVLITKGPQGLPLPGEPVELRLTLKCGCGVVQAIRSTDWNVPCPTIPCQCGDVFEAAALDQCVASTRRGYGQKLRRHAERS